MIDSIFKKQTEMESEIQKVLDKFRGTEEWKKSRNAFHNIIRKFLYGENSTISDEELDQHFERALTITQNDIDQHLNRINSGQAGEKAPSSPDYYLVNVMHNRKDQFFATLATDEEHPTGTGNQTLNAKFKAYNLYQRFPINATSDWTKELPPNSPFLKISGEAHFLIGPPSLR